MTTPTDKEAIELVRRVLPAVTPGPWLSDLDEVRMPGGALIAKTIGNDLDDAEFIALSRTVIPALLSALDRKDEVIRELVATAETLQEQAVGCAVNHYGDDYEIHGLPSYLLDTAASITRAKGELEA